MYNSTKFNKKYSLILLKSHNKINKNQPIFK